MRSILIGLFFLFGFFKIHGQEMLQTDEQVNGFRRIGQERVFVHLNTSTLLAGEYLYYKVYCFNKNRLGFSDISKIAYIELVGKEGVQVFRQKIRIEKGQGNGEFFIPTSVSSGSYKLLGYTRWMRNGNINDFFQADITIINPYQAVQSGIQKVNSFEIDSISDDQQNRKPNYSEEDSDSSVETGPMELFLDRENFEKRSKVTLILKAQNKRLGIDGNYSVSVRRKDGLKGKLSQQSHDFLNTNNFKALGYKQSKGQSVFLPELRGELFCGRVEAVNQSFGVNHLKLAISITGDVAYFDVITTNSIGNFCFNVNENYTGNKIVFQVLSEYPERYHVTLKESDSLDYSKLIYNNVNISSSLKEEILKRSVHNQIENSYFQFRPDSLILKSSDQIFDEKEKKVFLLDNFTRFKTVRETIVEIIKDVSIKRIAKNNHAIKVKGYDYAATSEISPLILYDGGIVQDHNALLEYDARTIEEISVMKHKLIFGPEVFLGVLFIRTKNGIGYDAFEKSNGTTVANIFKPEHKKNYFIQSYEVGSSYSRLPDDRVQLFWEPKLRMNTDNTKIDFFTSDVAGEFEIAIEGFTDKNLPVSIRKAIFVD